jgi:hypothetical protein
MGMGKKYDYAASAEACERKGREARDDVDATEWFGLAMYWTVLSRGVRPEDAEDQFVATLETAGTGQMTSGACH